MRLKIYLDILNEHGVLQLAVGGGEPLLYSSLIEFLQYTSNYGLVINIITNGRLITKELVKEINPYINSIQISLNGSNELINSKKAF